MVEQDAVNIKVRGSSPRRGANFMLRGMYEMRTTDILSL